MKVFSCCCDLTLLISWLHINHHKKIQELGSHQGMGTLRVLLYPPNGIYQTQRRVLTLLRRQGPAPQTLITPARCESTMGINQPWTRQLLLLGTRSRTPRSREALPGTSQLRLPASSWLRTAHAPLSTPRPSRTARGDDAAPFLRLPCALTSGR